ncbi:hypothetical protein I6F37_41800, partial [Bradyrhizobium sp. NBAIM08]|nr:hypothetical protein [Bradyrhizobium sp. NBAIM08]
AWTLSFEIKLYLMLLALFLTGILTKRWLFTSVYFLFLLIRMLVPEDMIKNHLHFNPDAYYHLGGFFLTGAAIFIWRDVIKISLWPILISAGAWFVAYQLNIEGNPFQLIFFAYLVLWLALKTPALSFPKQDISYGIY